MKTPRKTGDTVWTPRASATDWNRMVYNEPAVIEVGQYRLSRMDENLLWIGNADGEGMSIFNARMVEALDKLWDGF